MSGIQYNTVLEMWRILYLVLSLTLFEKSVGECTDGAVRLGGNSTNRWTRDLEGTVEVCALGQWGTIAGYDYRYFGVEEATVTCRQLGLSDQGAQVMYYSYTYSYPYWQYLPYYGVGSGSVVLPCGLFCTGNETGLSQCSYSSNYAVTCFNNHNYDIGVRCQQAPALAVSIILPASNQSTSMYAGMSASFWCSVGYSPLTGGERFLWRSTCIRDCTVWGQTSQLVTIDSLKVSDSGNYTCTVSRGAVTMSASIVINVTAPTLMMQSYPVIHYGLEEEGYNAVNLTCIATKPSSMLPPVIFEWSKYGAPLALDPRLSITYRQISIITSTSNLLLIRATVQDSSQYKCKAFMTFPDKSIASANQTIQVSITAPTSLLFQLQIVGVYQCQNWITNRPEIKLRTISTALAAAVDSQCGCGFSASRITKAAFTCHDNANNVLYRAQLNATSTANSSQLLSYVIQWVTQEGTTLIVNGARLYLDSSCSVCIQSFKDSPCRSPEIGNVTSSATPHSTTGEVSTTNCLPNTATMMSDVTLPTSNPSGGSVSAVVSGEGWSHSVGIIIPVVGILVLIIGIGLVIIALIFFVRMKLKKQPIILSESEKELERPGSSQC